MVNLSWIYVRDDGNYSSVMQLIVLEEDFVEHGERSLRML
jgi:hypothetical protein